MGSSGISGSTLRNGLLPFQILPVGKVRLHFIDADFSFGDDASNVTYMSCIVDRPEVK